MPSELGARVRAGAQDALVAALAGGVLTGGVLVRGGFAPGARFVPAAVRDALVTVVPALVVGTVDDLGRAGRWGGKTRAGLTVRDVDGAAASVARAVVRNAVRLAPWSLAHLGVRQQVARTGGRVGDVAGRAALVGALVLAAADLAALVRTGRALHDRWSGTWVARAQPDPATFVRLERNGC